MKLAMFVPVAATSVAMGIAATAHAAAPLMVQVDNITDNGPISELHALCEATPDGKSTPGKNERPEISWSKAPAGTQSFAVIVSDPDVPADFSKAGKDGMVVEDSAPRQMFYHWGLVDIPATATHIEAGKLDKDGKLEKPIGFGTAVSNDLGKYLPDAHNYGGPCPPWNDQRVHHYHFAVYALDVKSLGLGKDATAKQAAETLEKSPHVLSKGELVGTYTLNKDLRK